MSKSLPENQQDYVWECVKKQKDRTKWEAFREYLYDEENGTVLGRTPLRWLKLVVFYIFFYAGLAALFTLCLHVMYTTIDDRVPKYQMTSSLIGDNPGMGYRPYPADVEKSSVIWLDAKSQANIKSWTDPLDEFLERYIDGKKLKGQGKNRQICDYDQPPQPGKVCTVDFNSTDWGPCTPTNKYGFLSSQPCIFLKLNRIFGWMPEFYNDTNALPPEMPSHLREYIDSVKDDPRKLNTIWVSCHGDAPADVEAVGPIDYYPQPGFPGYFYPYLNIDGYLSPLVAVHLGRPALNRLITIECRVWAKNALYKKSFLQREGSVRIDLQID